MTSVELPALIDVAVAEIFAALAIDRGWTTSAAVAGGNIASDSTKKWANDIHADCLLKIIRGQGAGQSAFIIGNSANVLVIAGTWTEVIGQGAEYVIIGGNNAQALRIVLGGGANINAANPLPVDTSPGLKTTTTILTDAVLAAAATTAIGDCASVDLRTGPLSLALTIVATYNGAATLGLRVHVRTSPDDANWDSEDWDVWDAGFTAGAAMRETENYQTDPMYLRVLIENLDPAQTITALTVVAAVGA